MMMREVQGDAGLVSAGAAVARPGARARARRARPSALAQHAVARVAAHGELVAVAVGVEEVAARAVLLAVRVVAAVALARVLPPVLARRELEVVQLAPQRVRDRLEVHEVAKAALGTATPA